MSFETVRESRDEAVPQALGCEIKGEAAATSRRRRTFAPKGLRNCLARFPKKQSTARKNKRAGSSDPLLSISVFRLYRNDFRHPLPKFLAGLEVRHVAPGQRDGFAGARIAPGARWPVMQGETSETANLDALAGRQRAPHHLQERAHRQIDIVGLQVRLAARQQFDEFGFGHFNSLDGADNVAGSGWVPEPAIRFTDRPISRRGC